MDFFQFASYAELFVSLSMNADGTVTNRLWICLLVGGLCFLIVYIFQAVGLFTIAKREGYGNKWMAFVPFFNLYYIGVCAEKNKVYGMKARHFAVITVVLELLLVAGYIIYYVSAFSVWDYINWTAMRNVNTGEIMYYYADGFSATMPASLDWMGWVFSNLNDYILSWVELVFIVLKLLLLTAFFRTYSARQYVWFSVAGALLPLTGILIYVVRNNKGMSYTDYIRKVRERNYRMYQQQYGNQYNQNPYSGGYNGGYNGGYDGQNGYYQGHSQGSSAPDPYDGEYGTSSQGGGSSGSSSQGNPYGSSNGSGGSSSDGGSPFDEFN